MLLMLPKSQALPRFPLTSSWSLTSFSNAALWFYFLRLQYLPRFFSGGPTSFCTKFWGKEAREYFDPDTTVRVRKQKLLLIRHRRDVNGENYDNYRHLNGENCDKPWADWNMMKPLGTLSLASKWAENWQWTITKVFPDLHCRCKTAVTYEILAYLCRS